MDITSTARRFIARRSRAAASLALPAALLAIATAASAAVCPPPGGDCAAGSLQIVDFEAFTPGTSVEGLGAVHANLAITSGPASVTSCVAGSAAVVEELNTLPFAAYGTASGANNCLNGVRGFGDDAACVLNYEFTFSPGMSVSCFSIRVLDFGDFFPFGGSSHNVRLRAFAGVTPVDQDLLTVTGNTVANGDACVALEGDPGNFVLGVSGAGITRVTLEFDSFPDPNVGFDDIQFCLVQPPVSVEAVHWTQVKRGYRD